MEFRKQKPNEGQQFEPQTELETGKSSSPRSQGKRKPIIVENTSEPSCAEIVDGSISKEDQVRGLLSRSLEPQPQRVDMLLLKEGRFVSRKETTAEVYIEEYNSS